MRTREEHLAFCKDRARKYLERDDVTNAITSMFSDLDKHPETKIVPGSILSKLAVAYLISGDPEDARRYIEGFR